MSDDEIMQARRLDKLAREVPDEVGADVPLDVVIRRVELGFLDVANTMVVQEQGPYWASNRKINEDHELLEGLRQRARDRLRRALEARR